MFLPASIDLGKSEKYILSIRIKTDGLMFSIHEPESKNYCLRETTFSPGFTMLENVQRIIFDLNFLTQQFLKTNVVIVSSGYNIIPNNYYDPKEKEKLYNMVHHEKADHVLSCINEDQQITTLFKIESGIYEFLSRSLCAPQFYNHTSLIIDLFQNKGKVDIFSKMYIYFHGNMLDILCFKHSKLIHSITHEDETANNQAYFILKLWEKCGFDQLKDQVLIIGVPENDTITILRKYIKIIDTVNTPSEVYLWHEDAQKAPLDLLALSL